MAIINIVAPNVPEKITPPAVPVTSTPAADQNTVILCGANGSPKTFSGSFRFYQAYYRVKKPKEKKKGT